MQLKKITTGFVIQTIDTETGKITHQEFIAGDQCDYEDEEGNCIDAEECFGMMLNLISPMIWFNPNL